MAKLMTKPKVTSPVQIPLFPDKFEPGAPVAYTTGHNGEWSIDKVAKVYKSGNFTLVGDHDPRQYRPGNRLPYGGGELLACRAGDSYSRARVMLLDDAGRKVMERDMRQAKHIKRVRDLRDRLQTMLLEKHVNNLKPAALDLLEQALAVQSDYDRNRKPYEVNANV